MRPSSRSSIESILSQDLAESRRPFDSAGAAALSIHGTLLHSRICVPPHALVRICVSVRVTAPGDGYGCFHFLQNPL